MKEPLRLGVLVSANGRSLQNLLDHCSQGRLAARVAVVISSNPDAFAIERARRAGVETAVIARRAAGSKEAFSEQIFDCCRQAQVELVCMAGFLRLIKVTSDFVNRVMNIHPSLIPAFCVKGFYVHHVHEAVLNYGAKVSGCTVHFVDDEYDHGPIILQETVPVLDDDTPATLAERIFVAENEAYPEAIRLFAEGRLRVEGRRVRISEP